MPNSIWRQDGFGRFTLARAISWAGSAVTLVALPLLVYQHTHSAGLTALLTVAESLPYLAFGLIAGALADRWPRRRIMVGSCLANAVVLASIPAVAALDGLSTAQLIIVAFTTSSLAVFFDAASFGALPALVGTPRLAEATSTSVTISTIIGMGGPIAGGALAATLGASPVIAIDALTFLVAAALIARIPNAGPGTRPAARGLGADIADGLRFIWRHPLVRTLTLLGTGNSLTAGAVLGLLVVTVVQHLHLADDDPRIGLFYGVCGLGTLVAATLLPRLSGAVPLGWITLGGLAANCLLLLGWATVTAIPLALALLCCWQATNSVVTLNGILVRQQVTPDHLQGRVNTTARMIAWGGQPLGAALAGGCAELWGIRTALLIAGSGVLCAALLGLRTPLRSPATRAESAPSSATGSP